MIEQVKQVGITYVTQRYLWLMLGFFALVAAPQYASAFGPRHGRANGANPIMMSVGMPMLILLPFLVGLVKTQFAHSRARLVPQFFPAHLCVTAGILISLFLLLPLAAALAGGFQLLGLIALAFAVGAPALWGAHQNRWAPMFVAIVAFYSVLTNWGLNWWVVESNQHTSVHACTIAAGAILVVAWLWRLCRLREEYDDYQNMYLAMLARRSNREVVEQRRAMAAQVSRSRWVSWFNDVWHSRLGGYYGGNSSRLPRLLRYGFSAYPAEIQGLFMGAMIVVAGIFLTQFSILANSGGNFGAGFFIAQFAILLPGQMAGELLANRRPRVAFELLLPVSRRQLVDGLLIAAARNSFMLWLIMNAAMGFVAVVANSDISLRFMGAYLLLSFALIFTSMCASMRTSVWPSMTKRLIVMWMCMMLMLPVAIVWAVMREKMGDALFLTIAGLYACAGVWLLVSARRAWLNLEV